MISTTVFPGRYIQGYEAVSRLGTEVSRFGKTAFLVCSPSVYRRFLPDFREELGGKVKVVAEKFGGECCDDEIGRLRELAGKAGCEVIVGIGGGKTLDTAKAVASQLKLPIIIVPTVASSDAPCSAVSVIYTPEGKMDRPMPLLKNPDVVLVDTKIIAQAPVRFLIAGMGDALATWFEAESCRQKYAPNMTMTGNIGSMTAYSLSRLCYETLLEYGLMAKRACEAQVVVPALEHIIEANTLLSGLGFESCGLAAAHAIQIGFTFLKETHEYLHGEIVAFNTLASLFLTDKGADVIDEVYTFCKSVGLPTTLAEIGLADVPDSALEKVAGIVCQDVSEIRNEPMPVTAAAIFSAIKAADYEGKQRKQA